MNASLITYIQKILQLRARFSTISHVEKDSETMKVWARWIITHRSLCAQHNLILPDDGAYDSQFIVELQEKGVTRTHGEYLHDWLIDECRSINSHYSPVATIESGGLHQIDSHSDSKYTVAISNASGHTTLVCAEMPQTIPTSVYNRMARTYSGLPLQKNSYIWLCATIYSILDGKGLQWAVPPTVMELLQSSLGCYTELFASPLNAYNKQYYSLFPMDKIFGSKGNLFTAPDTDFQEGAFQINPPFIDQLFTRTSERVLELLDKADANDKVLTFIYIMPEWKDFTTYNMIAGSRFCVKRIYLRSGYHYYYQYSSGTYIPARFGSYMFFLSTDSKICSNTLESNIRYAFLGHQPHTSLYKKHNYN
jgi:hypothetical protein